MLPPRNVDLTRVVSGERMNILINCCAVTGVWSGCIRRLNSGPDHKMPSRRAKNGGSKPAQERQSREMRHRRLALFIQQFEKEGLAETAAQMSALHPPVVPARLLEMANLFFFFLAAQERMNELEGKLENMLATVDKVFKVELMKVPLALQKTRIGELLSGESSAFLRTHGVTDVV